MTEQREIHNPSFDIFLPRSTGDLNHCLRTGSRIARTYEQELGKDFNSIGSWTTLLGLISKSRNQKVDLTRGSLVGFSFADVGGGVYGQGSYGPNLGRLLKHLGAEVTIIDPGYAKNAPQAANLSQEGIEVVGTTLEEAPHMKKKDLLVSTAFIGSPGFLYGVSDLDTVFSKGSELSDIQIHGIHVGDLGRDFDMFNNAIDQLSRSYNFIYKFEVARSESNEEKRALYDFVIIKKDE